MEDRMAAEPLLPRHGHGPVSRQLSVAASRVGYARARARDCLSSRAKHYTTMGLVALDVAVLLLNVFVRLIACDMDVQREPWAENINRGLEGVGLLLSCLFMGELVACLLAFGPSYLSTWFHVFDSLVILLSFAVDVAARGATQHIGALVVALRLWRLTKLSEEIVAGAQERIYDLEQRNQELSDDLKELRGRYENR